MRRASITRCWLLLLLASVTILLVLFAISNATTEIVFAAQLHPQESAPVQDNRWTHFVQRPGALSSNDVWAVAATDDAIWVGTDAGVSRYNGLWTSFEAAEVNARRSERTSEPPAGRVRALAAGLDGVSVLAGSEAGVVYRWDGQSWTKVYDIGEEIKAIAEYKGDIFAGGADSLYRISGDGSKHEVVLDGLSVFALELANDRLYAGADTGLWRFDGAEWSRAPLGGGGGYGVYAISEIDGSRLALGTPDSVVIVDEAYAPLNQLPVSDELQRTALVQALAYDDAGRLWAGADGAGAYQFAPVTFEATTHGHSGDVSVNFRFVRDVAVDVDGSVWFATPTGVYRFQAAMWTPDVQGEAAGESLNHVNDLLVSQDGKLWIATGGGGVRVKHGTGGPETVYSLDDTAPTRVLVLEEDAAGDIWAGTFYGVFRFAEGAWTFPAFNDRLPSSIIPSLLREDSFLWIGTENGLVQYDINVGKTALIEQFEGVSIEALALDGLGRLWVGTKAHGLWVRELNGEWTWHVAEPGVEGAIPGNWIVSGGLAADWRNDGHMWAIVSHEGLAHWNGERWTLERAENQIPDNLLWSAMSETDPGRLWIGSEGGVTQYDGLTWGTLSQDDGLQSASAYAITPDQVGGYWIGGPTGLTHFQPDSMPPWVKISPMSDAIELGADGALSIPVGGSASVEISAGDLQTLDHKLVIVKRLASSDTAGEWQPLSSSVVDLVFDKAGAYELQVVARDQSFNYSEIQRLPVTVFVPPPKVPVPGLGELDPNIFTALIVLGLVSVLGGGYMLFEVMQNRRRSVEALQRGFNPYISGEPVRSPTMFYGRRELVQRIYDTLHNNSVMIHGERRIGKTTLLYQLASMLRDTRDDVYWFIPIYVDLEGTPEQHFFHLLIEEIAHNVARLPDSHSEILPQIPELQYRDITAADYDDRAFHRDLHKVIDVLELYGANHVPGKQLRLILLLDEMDVMSQYDSIIQQQLRRIFMREFATTVGAVVAGISISKEWDRVESPWYNMFNEIELEPFSDEDAHALLIEPVEEVYKYSSDALDFILDNSQGRPYRLQQYGLESVGHMLARKRRKVTMEDALVAHDRILSSVKRDSILSKKRQRQDTVSKLEQAYAADIDHDEYDDLDQPTEAKNA